MEYPKPEKRKSRQDILKVVDGLFSLMMRAYYSKNGKVSCCTCGLEMPWRGAGIAQWGHWKKREFIMTRWDPTNGGVQCKGCNEFGAGKEAEMRSFILMEWGQEAIDKIEATFRDRSLLSNGEIIAMGETMESKLNDIISEKGLE